MDPSSIYTKKEKKERKKTFGKMTTLSEYFFLLICLFTEDKHLEGLIQDFPKTMHKTLSPSEGKMHH